MLERRPSSRLSLGLAVTAVALLGVAATYLLAPLNGNLRYEAGVKEVGSAAGTFSHRPLAFRMLMDGVFRLAHGLSFGIASFELVVRVLVALLAVGAGILLWRGLQAHGVRQPGLHAGVAVGAILLVGPISTGEPDWMAVVLAIGGTGAALLGRRRPWVWALLAGLFLVAAAGMKIVTLPTALLGLAVVGLLDRRQLLRALAGSVVVGLVYVVVIAVWVPWELQWLLDIRSVQKDWVTALPDAGPYFAELAVRRPVLVLLPAALMVARRRERLVTALAVALTVATVIVQGQYFVYHAAALLVVAAVAVFRALRSRVTTGVGVGVLALVLVATALTTVNGTWWAGHQRTWGGVTVGVAVLALVWAVVVRDRRPHRARSGPLVAVLATLALLYPGFDPWSAQLLRPTEPSGTRPLTALEKRSHEEDVARRVRQVIGGPDVPVTYLTFGEWVYFIHNPTSCRYPSPLFLQRTRNTLRQVGRPSYEENLACLSAPGSRWLVWDPAWFSLRRTPADVQAVVVREWDCSARVDIGELRLCPRRR